MTPVTEFFGNRRTRLFPLSATHRFPAASSATPPALKVPTVKHSVEAVGAAAPWLQRLPEKSDCPQTSSATASCVKGFAYLRTRLLNASGTYRLPWASPAIVTKDFHSRGLNVISGMPQRLLALAGARVG